mmetsp:Transcript_13123/g.20254  ORF Transcript_13123/g.20254 Transcript_13123/m.20254 type:complete len:82 (+) Transcript_13123:676-921(+)
MNLSLLGAKQQQTTHTGISNDNSSWSQTKPIHLSLSFLLSVHNQRNQCIFTLRSAATTSNELSTPTCLFEPLPEEKPSLTI